MPTSKHLGYLLVASLAANLFLGGLYAGQWLERWHDGPEGGRPPLRFHLDPMLERLPEGMRAEARAIMEAHRPAIRGAFQEARAARRQVRAALRAQPFEPEALETALAEMRRRTDAARAELHGAMAELALKLPPEARLAMAGALDRRRGPPPE